jgi:hypothetical protein
MIQGNYGFPLYASTNYAPGATGATFGPSSIMAPISTILVTQGAARVLDYYDLNNNRITISLGTVTSPTVFNLTLLSTGPSLTPGVFYGFSQGKPF